jgi:Arc/MetJ family transcription regulator
MATNFAIDPDLLDKALEVSGERTKKAAVTLALREFIARREQRLVLELMGRSRFLARGKTLPAEVWSPKARDKCR